jgi:hypothetical protein
MCSRVNVNMENLGDSALDSKSKSSAALLPQPMCNSVSLTSKIAFEIQ